MKRISTLKLTDSAQKASHTSFARVERRLPSEQIVSIVDGPAALRAKLVRDDELVAVPVGTTSHTAEEVRRVGEISYQRASLPFTTFWFNMLEIAGESGGSAGVMVDGEMMSGNEVMLFAVNMSMEPSGVQAYVADMTVECSLPADYITTSKSVFLFEAGVGAPVSNFSVFDLPGFTEPVKQADGSYKFTFKPNKGRGYLILAEKKVPDFISHEGYGVTMDELTLGQLLDNGSDCGLNFVIMRNMTDPNRLDYIVNWSKGPRNPVAVVLGTWSNPFLTGPGASTCSKDLICPAISMPDSDFTDMIDYQINIMSPVGSLAFRKAGSLGATLALPSAREYDFSFYQNNVGDLWALLMEKISNPPGYAPLCMTLLR